MAKVKTKKEEVAEKTTDKVVETKGATEDGKLKVKKTKPSMKSMQNNNEPIKVDLSKPKTEEKDESIQESKTDEVDVQEQTTASKEVGDEGKEVNNEEKIDEPVIEEITEEKVEEKETEQQGDKVEETRDEVEKEVETTEQTSSNIPENIQKVVDFMNETGGDLEDYVKLNQDYSKLDDEALLREYYNQTKPHLNTDEINFLIEDNFNYDEDTDEEIDIKRKKLAFKEQVANAKSHMNGLKSKYYEEIKSGSKLAPEQQKAIDFFNRYNKEQKENDQLAEERRSIFQDKTKQVFNDKFKGFEYNVGEKKFRFNVKDVNKTRETQSDINNFVSKFTNKKQEMENAVDYHKSLFTAMNADAIANHFYEQGKADGVKSSVQNAKNIDMKPRQGHETVETGGMKVRAISGDDSNKLRFKIRNKS
jgi:hypothetical protein